jgi:hypothetical protein
MAVLIILAVLGGAYWTATFGSAYWDNQEVKSTLKEAANMCFHDRSDVNVTNFVMRKLHNMFDVQQGGKMALSIDFDPADLRIERITTPKPWVHVYLTYSRTVKTPLTGQERTVTFVDHSEADLSEVKW